MATTRIMPLHVGKGRTESRAISDIIDYVANPKKTDNGRLITGYACDSRTADAEFLLAKRQYIAATGRVRGTDDVIAYHVRQSFRPGEITQEEANRLGVEFAKRFTKGNHAFVVCTHIDKSHIHNHIIWSSVSLEYDRKFRNFWGSTKAVRRLSDTICIENGLSIVENPKPHGKSYNKWLGDQAKPSHRELLRVAIDNALSQSPADFAIVGTSGSGKSTLLNMMGGLDTPTSGSIKVKGKELSKLKDEQLTIFRRRNIGFIFQNYNLVPVLNVYENIVLPVELDGDTVDKRFMDEVVKMLALDGKLNSMPNNLSGGQQQRVAIARALVSKPAIILADEPTGNLDSRTSSDVLGLLKVTSQKFHQTLVMITHNNEIAQLADRIIRIEDGKIAQ